MLVGRIDGIEPIDSQDNRGTQYQFITITDANTNQPNRGRIGSKNGYGQQDIGTQIQVDVKQMQNDKGPYLYFKKHYDNPYSSQQSPQSTSQRPQNAPQSTNGSDMVRIRSMALAYVKDLLVADRITRPELANLTNEFTAYIMTGQWVQERPTYNEPPPDDLPF